MFTLARDSLKFYIEDYVSHTSKATLLKLLLRPYTIVFLRRKPKKKPPSKLLTCFPNP